MVVNNNLQLNPLVSFIVNCYNGEKYLHGCLASILAQTYRNWELVFWDNASTDTSAEIFKSYNDKRFKYFRSSVNVTLGQARAWAVNKCQGDFIAFLDVDDEWMPEKTEIQLNKMIVDDSVLSYSGIISIFEVSSKSRIKNAQHKSVDNFRRNLLQFEIVMPTIMINRKALISKKLNFDPNIIASEEYCLCMQLIYNEKVSVIEFPLAKYYVRAKSLTNSSSEFWAAERIYTLNKLLSSYPEIVENYKKELREAFDRAIYYRARHLMMIGEKNVANKKLSKIRFHRMIYFLLYILSFFPERIWNTIHLIKNKR